MFWESIIIALEGLRANKLRSMLTMLGIIIGVGAVIAMVSIGMGVRDKVQTSIASLGSNLLIVSPGATSASGVRQAAGSNTSLTNQDWQAIAREVTGISAIAPSVSRQYQIVYGNKNWVTSVQGTNPDYMTVRNFVLEAGTFFSSKDLDTRTRVAVLGKTTVDNLFADINPLGQTIRINKAPFRVIGVLEPKGQSAGGMDQDDLVLIPLTTAQERLLGITYLNSISVQAESSEAISQVQEDITSLLRSRHRLTGNMPDNFTVRNLASVMAAAEETTGTITLLLGNIAAISLVVGGIGIMNIIGIVLGIGASLTISAVAGWNTVVSPLSVLLAFGFSVVIGLFFGLYPARKAALLDPIDALRYE